MNQLELLDWPAPWPSISNASLPQLNGHREPWVGSVTEGLGHRAYLLRISDGDDVTGVLPLVLVSGPIFGRFLVSLPYLNTGGVWARDPDVAGLLIDGACELADQLNVKYLELRHEIPVDHPRLNYQRTDKVHMRLELPESAEALMKSFKSKLRSQIKKTGEYGLAVQFGGAELLDDFYTVFAHNMRDLGTPVFSRSLFSSILQHFEADAELCIVRKESRPIACGLLVHYGGVTEVPSASSLREFNRTGANMLLYRNLLERAIERGSHTFDFGRSSEGSGTYKFKAQWGAQPHPAVWQYYVRKGSPDEMRPDASGNQRMVKIWQRLPVWLTKVIGPSIVRGIP
ncbi:FemAB family protein [Planctomycetes bacterium CA13]|uniref:FemAB family protein n=1 Tax=Novipirellula herctigrandis TaxID=2527986 RepID=A0A5C5Z1S9_9BACT|nr:FemAB family protein [Planctomycetes bacterium CA13]